MIRRHRDRNGLPFVTFVVALIATAMGLTRTTTTTTVVVQAVDDRTDSNHNNNHNNIIIIETDEVVPHPDPNDEDHEGMIYMGRLCQKTGRRLLANESYSIQYIFGSSFQYTPNDDGASSSSSAKDSATPKTLKRFGHVETHPIDGGIVPQQLVTVEPFYMDAKPVSNADFAKFVARTSYITEAQRFGWSYVLNTMLIHKSSDSKQSIFFEGTEYRTMNFDTENDPMAQYWTAFQYVKWSEPYGQRTDYIPDHPVVHVSHRDAAAYCQWRNKARLPGEREYEAAARYVPLRQREEHSVDEDGNAVIKVIPWTDEEIDNYIPPRTIYAWGNDTDLALSEPHANLWGKGEFPVEFSYSDGFSGTSPVGHYVPNINGFYDLTGNVWEWMRGGTEKARIVRGGSFVDTLDGSTNHAATLGARATTHGTTTSGNIGFRCAKSVSKRMEHTWTWHDVDEHGPLAPEDEYIEPGKNRDTNDDDNDDDDDVTDKKKKKKVPVTHERIRTEL